MKIDKKIKVFLFKINSLKILIYLQYRTKIKIKNKNNFYNKINLTIS